MRILLTLLLLSCLGFNISYGQTCNGSLGDPIINIDFGAGTSLHSPNTYQEFTSYVYTTAQSVEDGFYSIKNSTVGDHQGGWWQTGDHTGNPGGYMMVVNANKDNPNINKEFYRQTIDNLCPGTTYEFAAWVLNLITGGGGIKPDITFTIQTESGVAYTYNTGAINNPNPNWKQYGTFFRTAANSGKVTLIMSNNAPGGGGNDIAIDDITFRACGPLINSTFISSANDFQNVCAGAIQTFVMKSDVGSGYNNPVYQWQEAIPSGWTDIPGATSTVYTATLPADASGSYRYRMHATEAGSQGTANCGINSNVLTLRVSNASNKLVGPGVVCEGKSLVLSADDGDTYQWTGPAGFTSDRQGISIPFVTAANAGRYTAIITREGCTTVATRDIIISPLPKPSAGASITLCIGSVVQLQGTGLGTYAWSPATGLSNPNIANPVASPKVTTKYNLTVTNANGCFDTTSVVVTVVQRPTANAGKDFIIHEGESVILQGTAQGKNIYWTPSTFLNDATAVRPVASPTENVTYTLHAETGDPCNFEATSQVTIKVYKTVIIPNTFTPNNDGINDTWAVTALDTYPTSDTQIFNRQGTKIYQAQGYAKPWDGTFAGKPLPAGVYYYKIDLKNGDIKSGWVTIVR